MPLACMVWLNLDVICFSTSFEVSRVTYAELPEIDFCLLSANLFSFVSLGLPLYVPDKVDVLIPGI